MRLFWAVVVGQLAEQSLPTSEIRGSNPKISKVLQMHVFVNCRKDENKEKESGNGPFKKKVVDSCEKSFVGCRKLAKDH